MNQFAKQILLRAAALATVLALSACGGGGDSSPQQPTAQTITFTSPGDQALGIAPADLVATSTSGLTVSFASSTPGVCTVSGTALTLAGVGTCTLAASQAGDSTYTAAAPVSHSITVAPGAQTISFISPGNQTLGTTPAALMATATSGLAVAFSSTTPGICTVSGSALTLVSVGPCTVGADQAGNASYNAAAPVFRSFNVAAALLAQPAQDFPLDFESSSPYPFTDFDGAVTTQIANPNQTGINTSATVMQLVKGTGAVWAGSKTIMAAPIDFSTKRIFKVKVFSPVAGIRLLLKFEGAGSSFQKLSAPITAENVWEELTFDFSAEAVNNLNNQIVFMFDFGTVGSGGPLSTYLFDDVTQSAGTGPILDLPVLPLNFESTSVVYPFADFGGAVTKVLPNPFPTGINKSATVVQLIKNPGETYAGSVIQMAGPIDFSNNKIVKINVWAPVAGKKLMLKFEGSPTDFDGGAFETDAIISKANEWVELTFDYNSPTLFPPVNNNDNKIVFFFDFGTSGDGSANSTYYFDDVAFSTNP